MAESKAELVRRVVDAFNRRDLDEMFAHNAPNAVFDWSRSIGPQRGVYRSTAEGRRWLEGFLEAWDEFTWDPEEIVELDPEHALLVNRVRGRGRGSGVDVNARGAQLWTIRDGRIVEVRVFQSRTDALRTFQLERSRLYFVCEASPGGKPPESLLRAALRGGADLIQLREKDLESDDELVEAARPFRDAARERGAMFVLNDRPELVEACEADGVHVGQEDAPVAEARGRAGPGAIVGLSTHSPEQLRTACSAPAESRPDYISVGPIWETTTKAGRPATGLGLIELAAREATMPWFAIGGIGPDNVGAVVAAGAERVVVVRAIRDADDPESAARLLRDALQPRVEAR